ncbi:capsule assembly Wzi family protein [Roseisolibacter agri]|uniref:Capsule assembly protein Wzi n=1 Tax=Roseisolibacter agri TaxID=2014610 RepID=A0AA37V447_9BACT|nr:capsule assembly Wzi family protein [Roseisolibacter agri]GLC27462.1 hypothetical protein rosag_39750 [Roseisolibacter agri]
MVTAVVLLAGVAPVVHGQRPARPAPAWATLRPLVGAGDDRARDAQLKGDARTDGYLLRSGTANPDSAPSGLRVVAPVLRIAYNSALPYGLNDGAAWAGRGASALVRAGAELRAGRVRLVLAPELAVAANDPFEFRALDSAGHSPFASPFYVGRASIDLPTRFGDRRFARLTPGQSTLAVRVGGAEVGASSENSWWGPGQWNALVLGPSAEGFPHLFARTRRPVRTWLGEVEARALAGVLTPSIYLDAELLDTQRAFSGVAATLRPARVPNLTLGVARTVVTSIDRDGEFLGHFADAVTVWSPTPDGDARPRGDQLTGFFARWRLPEEGTELYGEWARSGTPRSVRDFFLVPHDGQAFTLGARVLRPLGAGGRAVRVQAELTDTEQSLAIRDRPQPAPFYTGLATREGYTNRGQLLGAAIGPGGSAQWLAADHVTRRTSLGLLLGRIRWNNDALYQQQNPTFLRHDVSTLLGARATYGTRAFDLRGEATWARRYNYLFQNGSANPGGRRTVDVTNLTFGLAVEPR